ncbi:hypothetical protein EDC56_2416 [Sinobacterium caligoides]|uniref:Uncharacterized protein n=1 Tax=Sinobacterium caligoides TaxID=933926 RepID=A0A3N2DQA1_9GAMM|nr:hypothetical protein [Sinobacterium caligoides]ROS01967.1 hypothetical protein EDC56_2416 [Sinobacterium caligoides]
MALKKRSALAELDNLAVMEGELVALQLKLAKAKAQRLIKLQKDIDKLKKKQLAATAKKKLLANKLVEVKAKKKLKSTAATERQLERAVLNLGEQNDLIVGLKAELKQLQAALVDAKRQQKCDKARQAIVDRVSTDLDLVVRKSSPSEKLNAAVVSVPGSVVKKLAPPVQSESSDATVASLKAKPAETLTVRAESPSGAVKRRGRPRKEPVDAKASAKAVEAKVKEIGSAAEPEQVSLELVVPQAELTCTTKSDVMMAEKGDKKSEQASKARVISVPMGASEPKPKPKRKLVKSIFDPVK